MALMPLLAQASSPDVPQAFTRALTIYKQQGIRPFITAMVKDSPLQGRQEIRLQVSVLEKIEDFYGHYQSYDIVHINRLSESTQLIYFILNYEKGPVFGTLTAYSAGNAEFITGFNFHTKAEKAFPEALLTRQ